MGRSKVPLSLELIESDQIDDEYTGVSDRPKHYWRMGVELNEWGRPTRYAILRKHPGDVEFANPVEAGAKHLFIDAADFIHVYLPERVGQTRGVPWFAPVITTSWNLGKYEEAHWTRKRVQANSLGWIQTPEPETFGSTNPDGSADQTCYQYRHDPDQQRYARTMEDAAEYVSAQHVSAQQMRKTGGRRKRGRLEVRQNVAGEWMIGADPRRGDTGSDDECDEAERDSRQPTRLDECARHSEISQIAPLGQAVHTPGRQADWPARRRSRARMRQPG
ncbi:MAG: phage portal protein [Acidimicrobiia bacterium]|nr:phage portal protein [Acidimicrobiia bacterium]